MLCASKQQRNITLNAEDTKTQFKKFVNFVDIFGFDVHKIYC